MLVWMLSIQNDSCCGLTFSAAAIRTDPGSVIILMKTPISYILSAAQKALMALWILNPGAYARLAAALERSPFSKRWKPLQSERAISPKGFIHLPSKTKADTQVNMAALQMHRYTTGWWGKPATSLFNLLVQHVDASGVSTRLYIVDSSKRTLILTEVVCKSFRVHLVLIVALMRVWFWLRVDVGHLDSSPHRS